MTSSQVLVGAAPQQALCHSGRRRDSCERCGHAETPVYDHKTGERLSPHQVKICRRTECEAMVRHQLFEPCADPTCSRKVRCQFSDEMKQGPGGSLMRSRLVAMEMAHGIRFDAFAGTRRGRKMSLNCLFGGRNIN